MNPQIDFAQLVGGIGDAVIVANPEGQITYCNAAATRLFGFSETELVGQPLSVIVPERLRPRHTDGFSKSMETGTTRYGTQLLKVPALHKDGRTVSIAFSVAMLFGPDRTVTGVAAIIRDDTARFQEERSLKQRLAAYEAKAGS